MNKKELEQTVKELKEENKHLEKKNEMIWHTYIKALDEIVDLRIELSTKNAEGA